LDIVTQCFSPTSHFLQGPEKLFEEPRNQVIARSASDEATSFSDKDCFAPLAMTTLAYFTR
jgi:hypothetical protein